MVVHTAHPEGTRPPHAPLGQMAPYLHQQDKRLPSCPGRTIGSATADRGQRAPQLSIGNNWLRIGTKGQTVANLPTGNKWLRRCWFRANGSRAVSAGQTAPELSLGDKWLRKCPCGTDGSVSTNRGQMAPKLRRATGSTNTDLLPRRRLDPDPPSRSHPSGAIH